MFEHDTWQRFWAQGFVQCPFATNNAHKLSFAAEEAAMTTKTGIGEHQSKELEKQNYMYQPETRMHFPDVSAVAILPQKAEEGFISGFVPILIP